MNDILILAMLLSMNITIAIGLHEIKKSIDKK